MIKSIAKFKYALVLFNLSILPFNTWANWFQLDFDVMGTKAHVELWHTNSEIGQQLLLDVQSEMQRIDAQMSPYKPDSELSHINQRAQNNWLTISPELFALLTIAQDISKKSDGAFDITFASVGHQYDYRRNQKPNKNQLKQTITSINYQALLLDETKRAVKFNLPNMKIDLGGIAKGYTIKNCLAILKNAGVKHALVSAGGDTGLLGNRRGRDWNVGIKHPRAEEKQAVVLPLSNEAISTSGDYERFFIEDGVRYHHIINPKTGSSASEVLSVSIIGPDPTLTDALSTTVFVKGLQNGLAFINQLEHYEAIIIDKNRQLFYSSGLMNQ